jgi:hypothetical protein
MKVSKWFLGALLLAGVFPQPAVGSAVVLGQIDTFQDGTLQNWDAGLGGIEPPFPPIVITDGGPAGVGDHIICKSPESGDCQIRAAEYPSLTVMPNGQGITWPRP